MNRYRFALAGILAVGLGFTTMVSAQSPEGPNFAPPPGAYPAPPPAPAAAANDGEVLTKGAIHEAFAQPLTAQPTAGPVAPRTPPKVIEELPPEEKPNNDTAMWIPGYWNWDADKNDFVWVSGVWRIPPPGHQWVPGYWNQVATGYQWISGAWISNQIQEVQYLADPPKTNYERGPNAPSPGPDHFWVPGNYMWTGTEYAWRPGHWQQAYADWIWVPATYVWTPSGWIFVEGHWDQTIANRGMVFCPMYYAQPFYLRAGYYYRPSIVVTPDILTFHFFCSPYNHHYYFGDYYDDSYVRAGIIVPWYDAGRYYGVVDPMYAYYRWHYVRTDPEWEIHLHGWHDYYALHREFRPAPTFALELSLRGRPGHDRFVIGLSFAEMHRDPRWGGQMHGISREEQMHIHEQVREFRTFHEERARLEGHGVPGRPGERMQLARMPGHESLAKQLPPAAREKLAHPTTAVAAHPTAPVAGRPVAPVPGKPATAKPATAAKPKPKDSKDSNSR